MMTTSRMKVSLLIHKVGLLTTSQSKEADQNRINAELENEMSGLSSDDDDDFEASEFHRHLRQNETELNTTGSFSEFDPKNIYEQQQHQPPKYNANQYQHYEQYQPSDFQVVFF